MAAPSNSDEFLDLVQKSGVADEKRLDAYLQKARATLPPEPAKVAGLLVHNGILTNFQAENILAGKWRRFSIGKYKVLERLGSGGFAQVYLCEHKLMRRRVAVKVLPVAKTKDSSALERFFREARAGASLDHPNIVHAYDIDQDEDLHFLVMEYVDGANLQDIVKKSGPLEPGRACHYIREAALALQHAHEKDMVHRDIKPGNILVDRTGCVKVLDMGLALMFQEEDEQLTKKHDDGTLGTADYLSPEQAMDSHEVDIRTDIYSLGVTFYFLLTGKPPFEGLPVAQKLLAHQMRQPKPISEIRKDVHAGLLGVLDKMMAKKAEDRYLVPIEVADALAPFTPAWVAPPSEAELPNLSPAARGHGADSGGITKPESASARSASGATSSLSAAPPDRTRGIAAASTSVPASKAQVLEAPVMAPWEQNAGDTESNRPSDNTDLATSAFSSRSAVSQKDARRKQLLLVVLLMAFVVIPLILTAGIAAFIWLFVARRDDPDKDAPKLPDRFEVSRERKGAFPSIQRALNNATRDCTIELWDETYEESVVIDGGKTMATRITLQAAPGKTINWRPGRNDPALPIIHLAKASDFKFKGQGITIDGALGKGGNVHHLVMITSDCQGLAIDDLDLTNFSKAAVLMINTAGASDRPIQLRHLTTFKPANEKPLAAILFDANPQITPQINDHIEIVGGMFQGFDKNQGIHFKQYEGRDIKGEHIRVSGQ